MFKELPPLVNLACADTQLAPRCSLSMVALQKCSANYFISSYPQNSLRNLRALKMSLAVEAPTSPALCSFMYNMEKWIPYSHLYYKLVFWGHPSLCRCPLHHQNFDSLRHIHNLIHEHVVMCVLNCSVLSDSVWSYGTQPVRLLCPWDDPRQEYWSGSFPPPGLLPEPGIEPTSPALAGGFFTMSHLKVMIHVIIHNHSSISRPEGQRLLLAIYWTDIEEDRKGGWDK